MTHEDLPGRLGNPELSLGEDPRLDPRWRAAIAALGLDGVGEPPPLTSDAPREALLEFAAAADEGFDALFGALFTGVDPIEGVERETLTVPGADGNDIQLYVHRPAGTVPGTLLPCVFHIHGGGMVLLQAAGAMYVRWRDEIAASGVIAIGVEFRNGGGVLGPYPFPAGRDDCVAGLRWVLDRRTELGISGVVVSGESGGGNLTLSTSLAAKRQGWVDEIAGIYAQCPYISGTYGNPPAELISLTENDTYFLRCDMMSLLVEIYDPGAPNATNPEAWPYYATADDLRGMPPHAISVNELDPLRDEGLAYLRTLWAADVSAYGRVVAGTSHAGDVIGRASIPNVYAASLADLVGFVNRVV